MVNQRSFNELALFAGSGGGILGGHLLGWRTVCAVEWESYPASVLAARQNDKVLPPFPIWDDVQTFDGKPWRGIVDVVSGGFPCQDISAAGGGAGITGARSGMWRHMARIIGEVRPQYVFVENSPMLTSRGLDTVLADLATMGFDARWGVISAAEVGAPHQRDRIWIVAEQCEFFSHPEHDRVGRGEQLSKSIEEANAVLSDTKSERCSEAWKLRHKQSPQWPTCCGEDVAYTNSTYGKRNQCPERGDAKRTVTEQSGWWKAEPDVGRVADGVAARVDRLKAIGNGQVSRVAATAFNLLQGW